MELFLVLATAPHWCNKGLGMCLVVHLKDSWLLIGNCSPLSEWSITKCSKYKLKYKYLTCVVN